MEKSKKQLITYIVVTFALTWAYEFGAVWPAAKEATLSGVPSVKLQILVSSCMFFPALGMVLTRLITREGFGDMLLRPRFKGHGREYLLAYFAPGLLTILGAALYFLLFPGKLGASVLLAENGIHMAGLDRRKLFKESKGIRRICRIVTAQQHQIRVQVIDLSDNSVCTVLCEIGPAACAEVTDKHDPQWLRAFGQVKAGQLDSIHIEAVRLDKRDQKQNDHQENGRPGRKNPGAAMPDMLSAIHRFTSD